MTKSIALIGMPGSGKTTLGKMLSKKLGWAFIDTDDYVEQFTQQTIPQLFKKGESCFRKAETKACQKLGQSHATVIATGGGVVTRPENIEALKQNALVVFIDRPLNHIANDIETSTRPLLAGGVDQLYKLYKERIDLYHQAADLIVENKKDKNQTILDLIQYLKNKDELK